jgi:hypothetical protein
MKKMFLKVALLASIAVTGTAHALPVSGQGTWETTLQARDLDGNLANGPEAFYDTALNITWLSASSTTTYNWVDANAWAQQARYGLSGWRLPIMIDTGTPGCNSSSGGTDCGTNVQTKSGSVTTFVIGDTVFSEMANLYYVSLGNKPYPMPGFGLGNTGSFEGLRSDYWLGTEYAPQSDYAWVFGLDGGVQDAFSKGNGAWALAVRDGDVLVSPVPEPETYALMLAGLALVGAAARRRKAK